MREKYETPEMEVIDFETELIEEDVYEEETEVY